MRSCFLGSVCVCAVLVLAFASVAAASPNGPQRGMPCATGANGDTSIIGQTIMDNDKVTIIACLYPDAAHNTPPNAGIWKPGADVLGTSPTSTSPSVANDMTTGLYTPGAGHVAISTFGTERLVVDQNGNVGIGTGSPATPLEMTSIGGSELFRVSSPANQDSTIQLYNNDGQGNDLDGFAIGKGAGSGGELFINYDDAPSHAVTQLLQIMPNGDMGIARPWNSGAPQATLDVNGYARLSLNAAAPATCSASNAGAIALTHVAQICICDGVAWNFAVSGTACIW